MNTERSATKIHDACIKMGKYQPHELLRWLVGDVLAGFGVRPQEPPPDDVMLWLRDVSGAYARAAIEHPFDDVLGIVYQMLGSRGHRGALGQYFSPSPLAKFMAAMLRPDAGDGSAEAGRVLRMCEPACGSGALILGFMQSVVQQGGRSGLRCWSITCIDLDRLCAHICAAQVLSNLFLQRLDLGELVIYRGDALGPREGLSVVVHTTATDLRPDVVLPAIHPSRIAALREACHSQSAEMDAARDEKFAAPLKPAHDAAAGGARRRVPKPALEPVEQVDLFAD